MKENDPDSTQPVEIPSDGTQPVKPVQIPDSDMSAEETSAHEPAFADKDVTEQAAISHTDSPLGDKPKPRLRLGFVILGGILLMLLMGALGGYLGYKAALDMQAKAYREAVTGKATEQFMLAIAAQQKKEYELALRHIEYVIQLDPGFPGAKDKMAEIMLEMARVDTPTPIPPTPTITPSPTPDLRGEEEIFNNAWNLLANKQWDEAIQVLDALRDKNLMYKAIRVDGMYYVGLRHRGLFKIANGQLEEGIYDLSLVEQFGPLDVEAAGVRTWARLYIHGARFWGVNWEKVVAAFAEIYPAYPSMHDRNGMTATERYRLAAVNYGDLLFSEGKWCEAQVQYNNAQSIASNDQLDAKANDATIKCSPPTDTPEPTQALSPTVEAPTIPPVPDTPEPPEATPEPPADTPEPPADTPVPPSDTPPPSP